MAIPETTQFLGYKNIAPDSCRPKFLFIQNGKATVIDMFETHETLSVKAPVVEKRPVIENLPILLWVLFVVFLAGLCFGRRW